MKKELTNLLKRVVFLGEGVPISITIQEKSITKPQERKLEIRGVLVSTQLNHYEDYSIKQDIGLFIKLKSCDYLPEDCRSKISFTLPSETDVVYNSILVPLQELIKCLTTEFTGEMEIHIYDNKNRIIHTFSHYDLLKKAASEAFFKGRKFVYKLKSAVSSPIFVMVFIVFLVSFLIILASFKLDSTSTYSPTPPPPSSLKVAPVPPEVFPPVQKTKPQKEKNNGIPLETDRPADIHN